MREKTVAAGEIDDATSAKKAPHASSGFPGFVQFLPRQTAGFADSAADAVKQRVAGESRKVVRRQSRFG